MADGPKIAIGIDDSVKAELDNLEAQLRQAKRDVRELEKEAEKAIRTTGKVGDEVLKKLDAAKRRAGDLNSQTRGLRGLKGPAQTTLGDLKDRLELADPLKAFRRGFRGAIGNTAIGGRIGSLIGSSGAASALRALGMVGAAGVVATSLARGALSTFDRDVSGARLADDVQSAKAFGRDTGIQELELKRRGITESGVSRFARAAGDLPLIGGFINRGVNAAEEVFAVSNGVSRFDIANARIMDATKEMSEAQRDTLFRRAKLDADGNAVYTAFRDQLDRFLPEFLEKYFGGDRQEKIANEVKTKLERAKVFEENGYRLVEANSFDAANAEFQKSANEAGLNRSKTAAEAWNERENSMKARINAHNLWNPVPRWRGSM